MSEEAAASLAMEGTSVAVVGGGPTGMLCAAQFAKHGASVTVFERTTEAESEDNAGWSISLGQTAKDAIEAAGLSSDFGPEWRAEGISVHKPGKPERRIVGWGKPTPSLRLCTATQHSIAQHIARDAQRVNGARIRVERGWRLVGGAVCDGQLLLEGPAGSTVERQFDVVVGADGVHSTTRALMADADPELTVPQGTSALQLLCVRLSPQGDAAAVASLPTPSGQPFHAAPPGHAAPVTGGSTAFVSPSPKVDPGFSSCIVSFMHGRDGGARPAAVLGGSVAWFAKARGGLAAAAEELAALLPHFPVVWLEEMAAALVAEDRHLRQMRFITCSKLASGRAILLGDAAHAMAPNFGMGCSLALQDTLVLSDAIRAHPGDIDGLARSFDAARRSNAHAATRLSERLDAAIYFKYHGSLLRAVAGWPVALMTAVNYVPKSVPIPGMLRPGMHITETMQDPSADFRRLERAATAYFARVLAFLACGCALLVAAVVAVLSAL